MKFDNFALSQKYALAFLRVFYPQKATTPLKEYVELLHFFKTHLGIIGLIAGCPCPQPCYNQLEEFIIKKFKLTSAEQRLIHRLLIDRKIILLPEIFEHIIAAERARSNEIECTIELSHELPKEWQQRTIELFEHMTNKKIIPTIRIEPKLICGLRMHTSTLMYEKSLKKSLCAAEILAKYKGGL